MSNEHLMLAIPNPLWDIASGFAIYCDPGCCGVGAFELLPHHMKNWLTPPAPEEIALALAQADELLAEMKRIGPEACFEWIWGNEPNEHRYWLEDLRECIVEATCPPQTRADGTPFVREVTVALHVLTRRFQYRGEWYWPQPLKGPIVGVIAPEREVFAEISLSAPEVPLGKQAIAHLRFPLPARVQPLLIAGAPLDLSHHGESKTIDATILALG